MVRLALTGSVDQILARRSYFAQGFWTEAHLFLPFGPFWRMCHVNVCTRKDAPILYVARRREVEQHFYFWKEKSGDLCIDIEEVQHSAQMTMNRSTSTRTTVHVHNTTNKGESSDRNARTKSLSEHSSRRKHCFLHREQARIGPARTRSLITVTAPPPELVVAALVSISGELGRKAPGRIGKLGGGDGHGGGGRSWVHGGGGGGCPGAVQSRRSFVATWAKLLRDPAGAWPRMRAWSSKSKMEAGRGQDKSTGIPSSSRPRTSLIMRK